MKAAFLLILLAPVTILAQSQSDVISQLQALYTESAALDDKSLTFNDDLHVLNVSGYVIGVHSDTHIQAEGKEVVFLCQNGTQIIHRIKPGEPHAQLKLPMENKKSAKRFAKLFALLIQSS